MLIKTLSQLLLPAQLLSLSLATVTLANAGQQYQTQSPTSMQKTTKHEPSALPVPALATNSNTQHQCQPVPTDKVLQTAAAHSSPAQPTSHALANRMKIMGSWLQDRLRSDQIPLPVQFALVFLLGILMSLTPCIYPVIPLTVGALQSQRTSSFGFSFLLSCCYAIGLSTTFALMGLAAATSGQLFGSLSQHPIFILIIIVQLAYMAGSMFGWYEIYIPRFMQQRQASIKAGSLLSALTFGIISGTVASPCLSPGLALLLTIVATLGNHLLGFGMLFIFGLGLSTPLIIIGTFANALNHLPRAGSWMLEVKKLFGFMLIGMCLFFLHKIVPIYIVLGLSLVVTSVSAYYYYRHRRPLLTISFLILALVSAGLALRSSYSHFKPVQPASHTTNSALTTLAPTSLAQYHQYRQQAVAEHKPLLLDFGADWCTACKLLEKQLLHNPEYQALWTDYLVLKIDATESHAEPYCSLQKQYQIVGVPTLLVVNPSSQRALKRFGGELCGLDQAVIYEKLKVCYDETPSEITESKTK